MTRALVSSEAASAFICIRPANRLMTSSRIWSSISLSIFGLSDARRDARPPDSDALSDPRDRLLPLGLRLCPPPPPPGRPFAAGPAPSSSVPFRERPARSQPRSLGSGLARIWCCRTAIATSPSAPSLGGGPGRRPDEPALRGDPGPEEDPGEGVRRAPTPSPPATSMMLPRLPIRSGAPEASSASWRPSAYRFWFSGFRRKLGSAAALVAVPRSFRAAIPVPMIDVRRAAASRFFVVSDPDRSCRFLRFMKRAMASDRTWSSVALSILTAVEARSFRWRPRTFRSSFRALPPRCGAPDSAGAAPPGGGPLPAGVWKSESPFAARASSSSWSTTARIRLRYSSAGSFLRRSKRASCTPSHSRQTTSSDAAALARLSAMNSFSGDRDADRRPPPLGGPSAPPPEEEEALPPELCRGSPASGDSASARSSSRSRPWLECSFACGGRSRPVSRLAGGWQGGRRGPGCGRSTCSRSRGPSSCSRARPASMGREGPRRRTRTVRSACRWGRSGQGPPAWLGFPSGV